MNNDINCEFVGDIVRCFDDNIITVFIEEYNKPLFEEFKFIGGVYHQLEKAFSFKGKQLVTIDNILSFYSTENCTMTKGQRNLREKIEKLFGALDFEIIRRGKNLILIDTNHLNGDFDYLKRVMKEKLKLEVLKTVNNTRMYIKIPNL